ncbi:MAG TPA: hypothetical protein VNZ49_05895 [Bacteroidia bacterium]|jgi:hypothetical protein|nr:hypothetical protein [Bacteroidia bacterium]
MLKKAFFITFLVSFFVSCHNKLEILAPYKESVAVYGLLNQDDTVQYVRVQRVFLGAGNAFTMAQNPDSAYYKPGELKVSLQRIKNGVPVSVDNPASSAMEIVLTEIYIHIDTGVFNSNQLLYKTNHPIYDDSQYRLVIHNNRTKADFSSKNVSLVSDFSSRLTYGQQQSVITPSYAFINIVPSGGGTVVCKYGSPVNTGVCGLKLRFYYTEYPVSGPMVSKYKDMDLGIQYTNSSGGGEEIDLSFSGAGMINDIAIGVGNIPNISHRTTDSIHFLLNGAGPELALYNQVSTTTTLSQDKPYFTNIIGGVGIFSARREYSLRKRMTAQCLDEIASNHTTCPLHFYGSAGGFMPCQ